MKKYNKLEIIGSILLIIGTFFWISKEFFLIEALAFAYEPAEFIFWIGMLTWALGNMRKEQMKREQKKEQEL